MASCTGSPTVPVPMPMPRRAVATPRQQRRPGHAADQHRPGAGMDQARLQPRRQPPRQRHPDNALEDEGRGQAAPARQAGGRADHDEHRPEAPAPRAGVSTASPGWASGITGAAAMTLPKATPWATSIRL
ncbi:hypothetical protein [Paracoccus spongiarum]|uniref:Uncharacterized protein n=1 Tax=Paracoccus spongiarum TaxID=3064387 RepID=A0ABT9JE74_9RHOB|nr:hypothetical protein [Paracoccus sp. 2205BS29-5]MDP5308126.1 hypothetical protein [Paracoccus sp. 2205BS29-5]